MMNLHQKMKNKQTFKNEIDKFKESTKPKNPSKKEKNPLTSENANKLLKGR